MKNEFEITLEHLVQLVNCGLEEYLPAVPVVSEADGYDIVKRAMRYSSEAGGKRARPVLTLEFARLSGLTPETAMPFACAVECLHTYSLIHDDLPCMDNDALRRGKPSCHIAFGEANALLAGDALLTYAFDLIGRGGELTGLSDHACTQACRILAQFAGVDGMVGGQIMDLQEEGSPIGADTLRRLVSLKTSALLSAACSMGVVAGNGSEELRSSAVRFGELLGLAFQTVDDILDVTGDEAALGKPIGSDSEKQKNTVVSLLGLQDARRYAAELTEQALSVLRNIPGDTDFLQSLTHSLLERNH